MTLRKHAMHMPLQPLRFSPFSCPAQLLARHSGPLHRSGRLVLPRKRTRTVGCTGVPEAAVLHRRHIPANFAPFCANVLRHTLHMFCFSGAVKHVCTYLQIFFHFELACRCKFCKVFALFLIVHNLSMHCNILHTSPRTSTLFELQLFCKFCTISFLLWFLFAGEHAMCSCHSFL